MYGMTLCSGTFSTSSARQNRTAAIHWPTRFAIAEQMIADGLAQKAKFSVLFGRLNEAEVGGAAADVDD